MRAQAVAIELVLLAAWLGAAILFIAIVTPVLFTVLLSRSLAGMVVSRVLPQLFYAGMVAAVIVLLLDYGGSPSRMRTGAAGVLLVSCAVAQFAIVTRIDRLRQSIPGAIEALPANDARRVAFGRLHAMSVASLGLAIIAAVVAIVFAARTIPSRS